MMMMIIIIVQTMMIFIKKIGVYILMVKVESHQIFTDLQLIALAVDCISLSLFTYESSHVNYLHEDVYVRTAALITRLLMLIKIPIKTGKVVLPV